MEEVRSVEGIFAEVARAVEAHIDAVAGWDEPASLWFVDGFDGEIPGSGNTFDLCMRIRFARVLEGHPFDALIGVRAPEETLAIVLVTEAWAHSRANLARQAAGEILLAPSNYEDSREVRIAQLLLRDGTEILVQRYRDGDPTEVVVGPSGGDLIGGRVAWAARRVLGIPSRARPGCSAHELMQRILASPVVVVLQEVAVRGSVKAARRVFAALREDDLRSYAEAQLKRVRDYGDVYDWWRESMDERPEGVEAEEMLALLGWADPPLVAHVLEQRTLGPEALAEGVQWLRRAGVLDDEDLDLLRTVFEIPAAQ